MYLEMMFLDNPAFYRELFFFIYRHNWKGNLLKSGTSCKAHQSKQKTYSRNWQIKTKSWKKSSVKSLHTSTLLRLDSIADLLLRLFCQFLTSLNKIYPFDLQYLILWLFKYFHILYLRLVIVNENTVYTEIHVQIWVLSNITCIQWGFFLVEI